MASNHFNADGNVHMVDVSAKPVTVRRAVACSQITMNQQAAALVRQGSSRKGDVLAVARLAAISATKWTSHLIPLCHAIPIESVSVEFGWLDDDDAASQRLQCQISCVTSGKTGIEMEALTGASIATLTVYDMLKSVDRQMQIGPTRLDEKHGGQSGSFRRQDPTRDESTR
ncbi:cyclic pyranopterin monophosphate synthase MoaC [Stieleria sp. TO1_6]|uniref:cyclic pyranopterin monophosphate synthase MoaC n=1 Tax=Stieleria tagensis TaxID=2956795 RepID=UPI00209AAA39|nr:cyclic pyranopterin monophosphate synthase MoaC [Stieleria tagensis]MCO8123701.1 cyclic pyranopterin monophosphate synthase MoaC [Stieleria tagensis]